MNITKDAVVIVHYTLKVDGEVVSTSRESEPLSFLQGHQNVVPGFEAEIEGLEKGSKKSFTVRPEDGYGEYYDDAKKVYPKTEFPGDMDMVEGTELVYETEDNQQLPCVITQVTDEEVTIDFNHPLAGKTLLFSIEVMDVRKATQEELEHGHVHGEGGHHHH